MSNRPNQRKTARAVPPRPSAQKSAGPSRGLVLAIVGAAVFVIAAIAIGLSIGGDEADAGPQTFPVQISGTHLPVMPEGGADPAVGTAAPTVTGSTFDGRSVTIGGQGRPMVVMFLAHWCPHCRAEVPVITDWVEDGGAPDDVDLFAVSTSVTRDAPNYPPSRWLEREDWPITTIADDNDSSTAQAFGLRSYPYFVAVDADGNVTARTSGELTARQLEAVIDSTRSAS